MKKPPFISNPWVRSSFLIVLVLSIAIACSKKDDNPVAQTTTIEGNWKVSSLTAAGLGDVLPLITAGYGPCITDLTLSFKAGGAVSYDTPASCTASAKSVSTISAATGIDANSKWVQSGNTLTITPSTGTPKSFSTTFTNNTAVQLLGTAALDLLTPGTPTTYTLTVGLKKI